MDFFSLDSEEREIVKIIFESKVNKNGTNGCWLWEGEKSSRGYGRLRTALHWTDPYNKNTFDIQAHRLSWSLRYSSPVPKDLFCCHSCDVKACVKPEHIFIGTPQHNYDDARLKGRRQFKKKEKILKK